jgi:methylated-DNA-[protein]-cysteine S-methyltransferase
MPRTPPLEIETFTSGLGWMAMIASNAMVRQLVFGYPSAAAAVAALDERLVDEATIGRRWSWLVERLQDFAAGKRVGFDDVAIELAHLGPFQRKVVKHCRAIRYGQTRSYAQLAALAGSPRAARAVGTTMATNRFAIIVPCHRVISADGTSGHYGAPGGRKTKERLLEMERRTAELGAIRPPRRRRIRELSPPHAEESPGKAGG